MTLSSVLKKELKIKVTYYVCTSTRSGLIKIMMIHVTRILYFDEAVRVDGMKSLTRFAFSDIFMFYNFIVTQIIPL